MNWPKPLLPSQDRHETTSASTWVTKEYWVDFHKGNRFVTIFIWVSVLTGFALVGAAFAFYS